jgi:hypothetical protein
VKSAVAKVCGLGQFNFYMNGKKVGDHELKPAWTDYSRFTGMGKLQAALRKVAIILLKNIFQRVHF